jgi:ATP synthase protein I
MPPSRLIRWARGGALVFEFTGTITAAAVCGWVVDRWFETAPWGFLVVMLTGIVGAFVRLLQLVRRFDRLDRGQR